MTSIQRTILSALAAGAVGFVILLALGFAWFVAAGLGVGLALSAGLTLNYLVPSDKQSELDYNFREIDKAAARIRTLSHRVSDTETAASLQAGCDALPRMVDIIRARDIAVALPLSQRSLAYLTDVASTLDDYIDVQEGGDPEYLRLGQQELQRLAAFTTQPDKELSAQKMDDYISSLTALNMNPPPELT
ncbi:MAG: hypothetical protein QOC63_1945 [Mycobacterium sp.]|jgi:hypothetical protein|nr:hypothetical protein [Mycobacterium sp.]